MRKSFSIIVFACSFVLFSYVGFGQAVTTPDEVDARSDPREVSARLASKDPLVRQQAAESLARLAAVDQKKLLEGYRLPENDKRVRLALDWALFRVGKTDSLYLVITQLDSERHDQ